MQLALFIRIRELSNPLNEALFRRARQLLQKDDHRRNDERLTPSPFLQCVFRPGKATAHELAVDDVDLRTFWELATQKPRVITARRERRCRDAAQRHEIGGIDPLVAPLQDLDE